MFGTTQARRSGMTLLELIVGVVIIALVAGATAFTVSQSVRASSAAESRERVRSSAHLVVERVAQDIAGVLRDGDLYYARVLLVDGEAEILRADGSRYLTRADELLLFTQSPVSARSSNRGELGERGEGGEFEVQYRLATRQSAEGGRDFSMRGRVFTEDAATGEGGMLWRRVDPQPDDTPDGGGLVFPVMEGVTEFSVEALDVDRWVEDWDSDRQGYPHALRVTVRVVEPEVFGSPRREAIARKTVAIDRVPLPYVFVAPEDRGEDEEAER
jgi:prepilin-type N-terminal cleavage/methylation domain-containing protein